MANVDVPASTLSQGQRVVLVAGLLSQGMGQTMLFAILPPVARDLALSEMQAGLIITVSALFFMIATPIWGRLADRWGRKPAFVTGLMAYGITTLAFTFVLDAGYRNVLAGTSLLLALITARVAFSLFTGGIQTGATAMMADTTSAQNRASGMALVGASFGIGAVLGPALVAALAGFGILTPLFAVSALTFLMGLLALVALPETSHRQAQAQRRRLSPLDPRLFPILLMSFATFLCVSMHNQSFGFYVQDLLHTRGEETARNVGYGFIAIGMAMIAAQGVVVQLLRPSPVLLLRTGPVIAAIGYVLLLQGTSIESIVAAMAVAGFGTGLLQAGVYSAGSLRVSPEEQGAAAGWLASAPAAGFLIGPTLSAGLYTLHHSYPFATIVAVMTLLAITAWQIRVAQSRVATDEVVHGEA